MLALREEIRVEGEIIEQDAHKLPKGILCRVTYPVCRLGEKNKNNRVYTKEVWDKVHADEEIKEKIEKRCLFGAAEHPQETQSDLQKTSHIVTASWMNEKDNTVYQTFEILNTPYGRIVNAILEANCQVGVSTRAEGELEEVTEGEDKYYNVIPESYRFIVTDFTADPSTESPYPTKVERAVVKEIQTALDNDKIDEEFSALLLEKFKCKEATQLLESMGESMKFKADKKMKVGDKIKIKEGEHKDKEGTIAKIEEGTISITMEDGSSISVESATSIQILPATAEATPAAPEPEPEAGVVEEPAPAEEEEPVGRTPEEEEFESNKTTEKKEWTGEIHKEDSEGHACLGEFYIDDKGDKVCAVCGSVDKGPPKKTTEANIEELKMGADYIHGIKQTVKKAATAIADKDFETAAKELKNIADDADDAARAAKHMKRAVDVKAEADAESGKSKEEEPKEETKPEVKEEPKESPSEEPESTDEPVASEEPVAVGAAEEKQDLGETEDINAMYKAAGLPAPDGKGVHTKEFHELAINVAKGYVKSGDSPSEALDKAYPTAMKQLGKEKAVKKASRSEAKIGESYGNVYIKADIDKGISKEEIIKKIQTRYDWIGYKQAEKIYTGVKKGTATDWSKPKTKESKLIFENFDAMVNYFKKEFPKIFQEQKDKEDKKLVESSPIASVAKRLRELQISEASVRAERDKALEFVEDGDNKLESTKYFRRIEFGILSQKLAGIQEEKRFETNTLIAALERRTKKIIDVTQENKLLKQKQIEESVRHKKKVEEIEHKNKEQMENIKGTNEKDRIKLYVSTKLEHTGLQLHEDTRALLEKCTSTKQVDKLIEETQKAIQKSALHSGEFKEVHMHAEQDEKTKDITNAVTSVLESFN